MYAALNTNNELIYQSQAVEGEDYRCPICLQPLVVKKSKKEKLFFSHLVACGTGSQGPKGSSGESLTHQTGKTLVKEALKAAGYDAHLEYYLADHQQFPDIFLPSQLADRPSVAIEFQHSKVQATEIDQRTKSYQAAGIDCFWLLNEAVIDENIQQKWLKRMVAYAPALGFYLRSLDLDKEEYVLRYELPIFYQGHQFSYRKKYFALETGLQFYYLAKDQGGNYYSHQKKHWPLSLERRILSIQSNTSYRAELNFLYQQGLHLRDLPAWILTHDWQSLLIETPMWFVLTLCYLQLADQDLEKLKIYEMEDCLRRWTRAHLISWQQLPLVKQLPLSLIARDLLALLQTNQAKE